MPNTNHYNSITTLLWDWNGTLLNDKNICIQAMNPLLEARKLPLLNELRYKQVFTFPVKDYYQQLGFDFTKEPFDIPALEFMDNYHRLLTSVQLFDDVKSTLAAFKEKGFRQMVLSAMEQQSLLKTIKKLNIFHFFEAIAGIEDHFAHGKVHRAFALFQQFNLKRENILLIGDTLHDKEVADEMGCRCVLVSNGHQAKERLLVNGNKVVESLSELLTIL